MTKRGLTLWDRIDTSGGPDSCWPWTGPINASGYGRASFGGQRGYAHRLAFGPVPEGSELDHLCRNKLCCNPAHMEAATHSENMRRIPPVAVCPKGHSDYRVAKRGTRYCFPCQQESSRAAAARRKAGAPKMPKGLPGVSRPARTDRYRPSDPDPIHGCPGTTHR